MGDLLVGVAFHIVQPHHRAGHLGEPGEGRLQLQSVQQRSGLAKAATRRLPGFGEFVLRELRLCLARPVPDAHEGLAHGDLADPGGEGAITPEAFEAPEHLQKGFLQNLLGLFGPVEQPPAQGVDGHFVGAVEGFHGGHVPLLCSGDDQFVVGHIEQRGLLHLHRCGKPENRRKGEEKG